MLFRPEQVAAIRQGRVTAAIVPASEKVIAGRTRRLRRQVVRHDENGDVVGRVVEPVTELVADEQRPVVITILQVARSVTDDGRERAMVVGDVSLPVARACGFRTTAAFQEAWEARYPRTRLVQVVRFALTDVRDHPRFLAWTRSVRAGVSGDYTGNVRRASDEAEALSASQLDAVAALNGQRHAARAVRRERVLGGGLPSERLRAIGEAGVRVSLRREQRALEDRVRRGLTDPKET